MKKVWMCFRLDFGTTLHQQDKFQPWPAKLVMVSDAQFPNKKAAETYLKDSGSALGKGFFITHEVLIQSE